MATFEKTPQRTKRLFTIAEAGEYLGRTSWSAHHLIWCGFLQAVRNGRRVHIDIEDLDTLLGV